MELIIEPNNGPADVVCAPGGEMDVDVNVDEDEDEDEMDVGGRSETGGGGFEVVDSSDSGTVTGRTLLT
jgi:hypothetical protein